MRELSTAAILTVLCLGGCTGAAGDPLAPAEPIAGEWSGTWRSLSGVKGVASAQLAPVGARGVTGAASLAGSPCLAAGPVTGGYVSPDTLELFLGPVTIRARVSGGGLAPRRLSGRYEVAAGAGVCGGDRGWVALELEPVAVSAPTVWHEHRVGDVVRRWRENGTRPGR